MIRFHPAERKNVPLLIGLAGASGSGKTFSAQMLAAGIAEEIGRRQGREGRVFGIDTERGRMLHYADDFRFMHGEINPPFRPQAYQDALIAAEQAGADVVIVDSFSHEWEGEGGLREWADEILSANQRMKPPAQWKEPKLAHKRLVNKMLAMKPHIIVCLRAEEKLRMEEITETNPDGSVKMWNGKPSKRTVITAAKDLPIEERWAPICEKRFPYEITTSLLLTPDQPGVPIALKLQQQHRPFFPEGRQIGREAGRALANWAMGGAAPSSSHEQTGGSGDFSIDDARRELRAAAEEGVAALETAWRRRKMTPHRDALQPELDDLKRTAERTRQPEPQGVDYDGV
jgi:hypothetical protein